MMKSKVKIQYFFALFLSAFIVGCRSDNVSKNIDPPQKNNAGKISKYYNDVGDLVCMTVVDSKGLKLSFYYVNGEIAVTEVDETRDGVLDRINVHYSGNPDVYKSFKRNKNEIRPINDEVLKKEREEIQRRKEELWERPVQ